MITLSTKLVFFGVASLFLCVGLLIYSRREKGVELLRGRLGRLQFETPNDELIQEQSQGIE
jgi:hypothetical protein